MRTDAMFDLFALHQWATDGGPAFDDSDELSPGLAEKNLAGIFATDVAPREIACPIYRVDQHRNSQGAIMTQQTATEAKDILIHAFHVEAECEYSGKTGEAVEISTTDHTIQHAVICMAELTKLLRFRHRQQEKQTSNSNGNGTA